MEHPHHVVILGGGFAGLNAARSLRRAPCKVTLVDRRNFHLFQPLLYQVATGMLSPADIASTLRDVLRRQANAHVILGEVAAFDVGGRRVILSDGDVPYDTLVVALGMRNHYFGNPEWAAVAPGLKTIEEATEIRKRVLLAFERAEREPDPAVRREWLTFAIIGGGPTGVELAGTIGELARDTLRHDFRVIDPREARVLLLEGGPRILSGFHDSLGRGARRELERLGVATRTGTKVTRLRQGEITVDAGDGPETILARTILWAAGVRASDLGQALAAAAGASTDRSGRVVVEPDLTVPGHPEILVLGDLACVDPGNGSPLPGVAPVAMQEGKYAGQLIERRLRGRPVGPFRYRDKGSLATVGRSYAIAQIGRFRCRGLLAWLLWVFVHIMYLVGFENRLIVLVQWAWNYLTWNRGARLITSREASAAGGSTLPSRPESTPECTPPTTSSSSSRSSSS